MKRILLAASIFLFSLTGCSTAGSPDALCTDAFEDAVSADFSEYKITENISTPGGSIDIRGEYSGGTFACGLSREDGVTTLHQAIVYYANGNADTVINGGEKMALLGP